MNVIRVSYWTLPVVQKRMLFLVPQGTGGPP